MIYGVDDIEPLVAGPPDTNYTTAAVHFNGSTWLTRGAALTGWGTPSKFTAALWTKLSACDDGIFGDANYFVQGATQDNGNRYINIQVAGSYADSWALGQLISAGWQGLLISLDISTSNSPVPFLYLGDNNVLEPSDTGTDPATTIPVGSNFWFGQDGFGVKITGDVADFRLWLGTAMDFGQQGNRRYFVRENGKPADPSYALALLGTPIISFIGNSTAFPVNGGSGGSFTVTGSLSNAGTSPTD